MIPPKLAHTPYNIRNAGKPLFLHIAFQSIDDLCRGIGVEKVCRPHCYHRSSRHKKLQGILGVLDPAHAKHWDLHRVRHLVHHTHRHRLHTGTGHSCGLISDGKGLSLHIDLHSRQCVDQGNPVGAACLHRSRHLGDVCHIGA